jgi:hypothetical protein
MQVQDLTREDAVKEGGATQPGIHADSLIAAHKGALHAQRARVWGLGLRA